MENRYPDTIVARVVDALKAIPASKLDLVVLEYPGFIHIETDRGRRYATGVANDTWTIDRLNEGADTEYSIDTDIPTSENDATTIASAIDRAIQEDEGHV